MSRNYRIQMKRYNGTDYDNLFPDSVSTTDVFNGYTTPQQYGAAADGTTDDSEAMQNAIDSGKIVICSGSFKLTGVTLSDNTYILGQGCTFVPTYDNDGIVTTMFYGESVENIIFENVNFEGTYTASTDDGLYSSPLIEITEGSSVTFRDCLFKNIDGMKCNQYKSSGDTQYFWKQNGQVLTLRGVENSLIQDCVFDCPSANEAIWILPYASGNNTPALTDVNVKIDGLSFRNCLGDAPLNMLCESANLENIYYDSACQNDNTAMYCYAKKLNIDGVNCLGTYKYGINCDGRGRFLNDNVNISNVNFVCQTGVAITCVSDHCNISNLTGQMCGVVDVNNVIDASLNSTFFPWKRTVVNSPDIAMVNINIDGYDGDLCLFMVYGTTSTSANNGTINLSNSNINIVEPNTTYHPITLYCANFFMNNTNVIGKANKLSSEPFLPNYGTYIEYNSTLSGITKNSISVKNCCFTRTTSTGDNAIYLCTISGCIGYVNVSDNVLDSLLSFNNIATYIVRGNYADELIIKNNKQRNMDEITHRELDFYIGYRHGYFDYPVALGFKAEGDMFISSDAVAYAKENTIQYNRIASSSSQGKAYVGDVIGYPTSEDEDSGTYNSAYVVIESNASSNMPYYTWGSTNSVTPIGTIKTYTAGNVSVKAICIANRWTDSRQVSISGVQPYTTLSATFMGYTS